MPDILLIDDNPHFRLGLAANLRKAGFSIVVASSGAEGIKLAHEVHPEIILCDLKMPSPNGMEVKRMLNEAPATADIPFVFLSAFSTTDVKCSGLEIGADDYIIKTVDMIELNARIRAILKRKNREKLRTVQEIRNMMEHLSATLPIHTSHQFRTNLGVMSLSLEMISRNPASSQVYLAHAKNSAFRMKFWVETLVWLNELDMGCLALVEERLDLNYSFSLPLAEVLEFWKEKNLSLDMDLAEDLGVFAPARSFTLALSHLVDNACKFSPDSGKITVQLLADSADYVKCMISDQGPGIPQELQDVVFERFSQVSINEELPENFGMGLGLYVARSFARMQGGDVQILPSAQGCTMEMKIKNQVFCPRAGSDLFEKTAPKSAQADS